MENDQINEMNLSDASKSEVTSTNNVEKDKGVQMEESSRGKVKGSVSLGYFKAGAHWPMLLLLAGALIFVQMIASGLDYWVSVW